MGELTPNTNGGTESRTRTDYPDFARNFNWLVEKHPEAPGTIRELSKALARLGHFEPSEKAMGRWANGETKAPNTAHLAAVAEVFGIKTPDDIRSRRHADFVRENSTARPQAVQQATTGEPDDASRLAQGLAGVIGPVASAITGTDSEAEAAYRELLQHPAASHHAKFLAYYLRSLIRS